VNENVTERKIWICGCCCVTKGFLLRTEANFKWGFFGVFYLPGHIFKNRIFRPQNNQALTTFLKGSVQVYKEPGNIGGMDGTRTRSLRSDSAML
jgi:hypothetical protein